MVPKRLELLSRPVPQVRTIALLVNPNKPNANPIIQNLEEATRIKGLQLYILKAVTRDIDAAFASLIQSHAGAPVVGPDPLSARAADQTGGTHTVPAIYDCRVYAAASGLISYAPSIAAAHRQASLHVGKILNSAKPADLPVQQPTRFELVVNLKTAETLGPIPRSVLASVGGSSNECAGQAGAIQPVEDRRE